jgi:nitrite reductase (NADH) small subunit
MAFQRVASLSRLPQGSMLSIDLGTQRIALCRTGASELYALDGVCPHRGGSLGEGALHGTIVVCPWHAWEFDCTTGANGMNPDLKQRLFDVKIQDDDILVDVEDGA